MTDIVTYCDVNTCEECPRYGDDCDGGGDAEMDNCQVQVPQNYMQQSRHDDGTDLISRADAVHGEWEFVDNEIFAGEYFCSICGKRAEVDLYGEWILSNFCPSCGARMKGGAE